MRICDYTVDELRSILQRSNVNTLLTEGRDDYSLFRGIRTRVGYADLLPAGGKDNVLLLRESAGTFTCPKTAFLVDKDLWLFQAIPNGILGPDLTITDGYSIENDMLRDFDVEGLLDEGQQGHYQNSLEIVINWFASGVTARLSGGPFDFDRPISQVLDPITDGPATEAQIDMAVWPADVAIRDVISSNYGKFLRGKTWLKVLAKYLCHRDRAIHHPPNALLEIGMRSGGAFSTSLVDSIRTSLL